MKIMLSQSHSKIIYGASCAVAALFFLFAPSKANLTLFKSAKKVMSIQASRKEPPRIAFETLLVSESKLETEVGPVERTINLNEREFGRTKNAIKELRTRKIALKPMVIKRQFVAQEPIPQDIQDNSWINELRPEQQRILAAADQRSQILEHDWSSPGWREVLAGEVEKASKAVLASEVPSSVYVSGERPDGTVVTPATIRTARVEVAQPTQTIIGKLEVDSGIPVAKGYFDVRHVSGGVATAAGTTNSGKGEFAINVNDMNGSVVAAFYNNSGQKIGEGQVRLSKAQALNDYKIKVLPVINKATIAAVDFNRRDTGNTKNKYGDHGAVNVATYWATFNSEAKSDSSGLSTLNDVTKGSWMVARSENKAYYPSIHLLQSGQGQNITQAPVFRKSLVDALLSIAEDQALSSDFQKTNSVVWGQVLQSGKPQAGIEVGVEQQDSYQIVYFNALLIPDPNLKATSENGYFAVLHLPEGFYSLVARRGNQYFGHINAIAEPDTASFVEIVHTSVLEKATVRVFDAFTGQPGEASLEMQSLQEPILVNGDADVYLPQIDRLSFMNSNPTDRRYIQTQSVYTDTQDTVYSPLISGLWLQSLKAEHKITTLPDTSDIVGFVSDGDYEVFLSHIENFPAENIIYFDSQGRASNTSVAGGGFVITHVPPGTHSVVLLSKESKMMSSQVIPVDLEITTTVRF